MREKQAFFQRVTRHIMGRDKHGHSMTIARKAGAGVGNFADVTKLMSAEKLRFIRTRAQHAAREAFQRQLILSNPFMAIRKRII
jgi:hypothetical protein